MEKYNGQIIYAFEKAGWYKGRKIDLKGKTPSDFNPYPDNYSIFISEFIGLKVENKGSSTFEVLGEQMSQSYCHFIDFNPMIGEGLNSMNEGDEGDFGYFSEIIEKQLYPIGDTGDDWYVGMDKDMHIYLFNMGFNCYRVHTNPYEGIRCILENDLYSTTYVLGEEGEKKGKWFKRE